ncbi:ABC transporter ATP-binding protein [Paenibacillus naphthalenovorans]|uniref:ABC transporter ATP-binding protein n=1 Tax=Paenibacillus naphthalenovorans TaxID=162209 RepID=UPI003D28964E
MLSVRNVHVNYGPIKALKGVSLDIRSNGITAIIGANGSGKTTLLHFISGLVTPEEGDLLYEGISIAAWPTEARVKHGIAHVMEGRRLFKDQTVYDNLLLAAHFRTPRLEKKTITNKMEQVFQRFPILESKKHQPAGTLSGGQQQLLIISAALLSGPKLLLLDEPSLGLAPVIIDEVYSFLQELKQAGMTIFISEQMAALALRIADYGYVLDRGAIVKSGDSAYLKALLASDDLSSIYLGKGNH